MVFCSTNGFILCHISGEFQFSFFSYVFHYFYFSSLNASMERHWGQCLILSVGKGLGKKEKKNIRVLNFLIEKDFPYLIEISKSS